MNHMGQSNTFEFLEDLLLKGLVLNKMKYYQEFSTDEPTSWEFNYQLLWYLLCLY